MSMEELARSNLEALRGNAYPGRGIVIENSRNRVFVQEDGTVRTKAHDETKVTDPSLIMYYPVRVYRQAHIVSNGDQTDTILAALQEGGTFEEALMTRTFEPDAPNFTPRIAGLVDLADERSAYQLAILKAQDNNPDLAVRQFFNYAADEPGIGHCITTYKSDGSPLPAFNGEPYVVELMDDVEALADCYWGALNEDNRVSLLAKFIHAETGETDLRIVNKHGT
jgi:IMP cyclohydrolase